MDSAILLSYKLDGKGGGSSYSFDASSLPMKKNEFVWTHLDATHPETRNLLTNKEYGVDQLVIDALLADETRPRMMSIGDGVLLILRGINLNETSSPEDMVSIRLWITKDQVISTRRRQLKSVSDLEEKIKSGHAPKNTGQFVCMLISHLLEKMNTAFLELDEEVDNIEAHLIESADTHLRNDIIKTRKQAIMFRRYIAPQRDAIGQLYMADTTWMSEKQKHILQESFNNVTRYVEDLDAIRERAQVIKDELSNILSDKLNKNMYALSVVAAIFLPLGFLTGLLGINIGGIPGVDNPYAFAIFTAILVVIVALQIVIFKKLKWF